MKLNDMERQSAVWRKLEDHLTARVATLRARNDGNHDPIETAKLRGRIAEIKELIALGQPSPVAIADEH